MQNPSLAAGAFVWGNRSGVAASIMPFSRPPARSNLFDIQDRVFIA
jgi:hypothetical protein